MQPAHDRRVVEITYVVVSSVVLFATLAVAYKFLVVHVEDGARGAVSALGPPGAALVIALLVTRGIRLLSRLEVDIRGRRVDE